MEPLKRKSSLPANQNEKLLKTSQHNVFICTDSNCDDCKTESIEVQKDHDYPMNTEGYEPMESDNDEAVPEEMDGQKESENENFLSVPDLTYDTEEVTVKSCTNCEDLENSKIKMKEEHDEITEKLHQRIAELEATVKDLSKPWNPDQVKKISLAEGAKIACWSDLTIKAAIDLYYSMGATAYNKLLTKGLPYPSLRTIRRHLSKVDCSPGVLYHIMELIRNHKVDSLPEQQRFCGMSSDELSLTAAREYDRTTQSIVGAPTIEIGDKLKEKKIKEGTDLADVLATKGCNAMICGLQSRWKQVCGFHFTGNSFNPEAMANWHKEMIIEAKKSKLITKSLCLDMGPDNVSM